jgi:rhodanese-related sulfurtransferase
MSRLHSILAIIAALSAAGAAVVDRGNEGHRRTSVQPQDFISAPELAGRIMRIETDLRVIDLRPLPAFEQFHVPGARPATIADLADVSRVPLTPSASVVLYADDRATLSDAIRALRLRNHRNVRVLKEGIVEWLGRVQEPRLAVDATPAEREEFERAAEMSRFFGGVPRAGVARDEVPPGYWTGTSRSEELLVAAALRSVAAIRRRGC